MSFLPFFLQEEQKMARNPPPPPLQELLRLEGLNIFPKVYNKMEKESQFFMLVVAGEKN